MTLGEFIFRLRDGFYGNPLSDKGSGRGGNSASLGPGYTSVRTSAENYEEQ